MHTAAGGASAHPGLDRGRLVPVALALVAALVITLMPVAVEASSAAQQSAITDLTAVQEHGYTTLRWSPVAGVNEYEIERIPVNDANEPTGDPKTVGTWRPNRQVPGLPPTFAESGFVPGQRYGWRVRPSTLPNEVTVDPPSPAAGTYGVTQATFGSAFPADGISGDIVLVNAAGTANPTQACGPLEGFPAGAIALVDRGCTFVTAAANVQAAGAVGMLIVNNVASAPTNPTGTAPGVTIPVGMLWQDDGNALKAGLPASGTARSSPAGAWSEPVFGTTLPQWGDPANTTTTGLRTQWETSLGAQFTNDTNEYAYTAALDAASDRVRVVELGRTVLGRPINMFIIGHPAPPGTAEEIAAEGSAMVNCNVHGNEPSSREACLIMARELAFSDDPRIVDILTRTTVLIVPTINGDGRAANSRGNSTGQDLNRDHSLIAQPETFAFATALRDYQSRTAFDGHEYGNNSAGDLPILMPRHLNVAQEVFDQSSHLIQDWMYNKGSEDGWWFCPYGCQGGSTVGMSEETILRNTLGLKNVAGILLEARSGAGPTRNETTQENRRRKTYSAMFTYHEFLDYYIEHQDDVEQMWEDARAFQISNTGRIVWRGTRPVPAFPAPHPGESPPNNQAVTGQLTEPPCGYRLTDAQVNGPRTDGPAGQRTTIGERMAAHGWTVEQQGDTYLVRLNQPQRGLIPLLLDGAATQPWVSGERLYQATDCVTVLSATEELDRLVASGGITLGMENRIRHALEMFERWIQNPRQRGPALAHLERAVHLLLWQADVIDRTGNTNQGDPAGLRALAATIQTLRDSYGP